MTTRAKRSAKPLKIEALLGNDREPMKQLVQEALQACLEAELTEALGAESGEQTAGRLGYRAGYYSRGLVTRIGTLELRVPRDRAGRCGPARRPALSRTLPWTMLAQRKHFSYSGSGGGARSRSIEILEFSKVLRKSMR